MAEAAWDDAQEALVLVLVRSTPPGRASPLWCAGRSARVGRRCAAGRSWLGGCASATGHSHGWAAPVPRGGSPTPVVASALRTVLSLVLLRASALYKKQSAILVQYTGVVRAYFT